MAISISIIFSNLTDGSFFFLKCFDLLKNWYLGDFRVDNYKSVPKHKKIPNSDIGGFIFFKYLLIKYINID